MNETRERLAEYAHDAWARWMRHLFEKSTQVKGGAVTIPIWAADRWKRQMDTEYDDLPEKEKESDRHEAGKMIAIMMKAPGKMLCRGKVRSGDPTIRERWAYGYFARVGGKDIITDALKSKGHRVRLCCDDRRLTWGGLWIVKEDAKVICRTAYLPTAVEVLLRGYQKSG